jgi:hypothetical protein
MMQSNPYAIVIRTFHILLLVGQLLQYSQQPLRLQLSEALWVRLAEAPFYT